MIYLDLRDGLCNRLRAIASLYSYMKDNNIQKKVKVYWFQNKYLNCPFEELLFPIEGFDIINIKCRKIGHKYITPFYIEFKRFCAGETNNFVEKIENVQFKKKNVYIRTGSQLYANTSYEMIHFRIDNKLMFAENNNIGLHIRRSDNDIAIKESPIELFKKKIKQEIEIDNTVCFYLATDDDSVKEDLINMYGEHIICQEKLDLSRESEEGMKRAVVDLLNLANCKKIYGSFWSSFSETASAIGKNELIQLRRSE